MRCLSFVFIAMGPGRDSGAARFDILLEARDFYRQNFPFVARARLKIAQRKIDKKQKSPLK